MQAMIKKKAHQNHNHEKLKLKRSFMLSIKTILVNVNNINLLK